MTGKNSARWDVVVLGAGGRQAQAMLNAAARSGPLDRWLCVDLAWDPARKEHTESLGASTSELDVLADDAALVELTGQARVVANMVGPYFRTAGPVLEACIATGTDYLDICDDADATAVILELDERATAAGVRALTGMGASPGLTNVFVRAAHDVIGGAEEVDISWSADARDASPAIIEHMWHIFEPWDPSGVRQAVPDWASLRSREVNFRGRTGDQWLVELAHSELVTLPHFLGTKEVVNFGGVAPADFMVVAWAQARMGSGLEPERLPGVLEHLPQIGHTTLQAMAAELEKTPRVQGGLRIDVTRGGRGLRFETASDDTMEDSTGKPAAAGILLMLDGALAAPGVSAPEMFEPVDFFTALGRVSESGGGSLEVSVLEADGPGEVVGMGDVLTRADSVTALFAEGSDG